MEWSGKKWIYFGYGVYSVVYGLNVGEDGKRGISKKFNILVWVIIGWVLVKMEKIDYLRRGIVDIGYGN